MKELSDNKFDELLKQKAESVDFDFDESSWDKMEQKLRKRDRMIFFRNSSLFLLLLLLAGGSYFLLIDNANNEASKLTKTPKSIKVSTDQLKIPLEPKATLENTLAAKGNILPLSKEEKLKSVKGSFNKTELGDYSITIGSSVVKFKTAKNNSAALFQSTAGTLPNTADLERISSLGVQKVAAVNITDHSFIMRPADSLIETNLISDIKPGKNRLAFSLTVLAGPEFSAVRSIAGKKGNLSIGLLLNATYRNKLTLSSGIKYGVKNYEASAYDYDLTNPSRAPQISGIDASCNILEIPLQASYAVYKKTNKNIAVSAGLSSYLMLKEKYNFRYTPQSGRKDFSLEKTNENQHYLSVLSLSAIYQIKPKSSNVHWAIEPFVKLPLGGVGEGNVKLKSSGISLNLTYDIKQKNP